MPSFSLIFINKDALNNAMSHNVGHPQKPNSVTLIFHLNQLISIVFIESGEMSIYKKNLIDKCCIITNFVRQLLHFAYKDVLQHARV